MVPNLFMTPLGPHAVKNYEKNCSTPNQHPSPIQLVGLSIIIAKIYYYYYYYYYSLYSPVKHLCRKNSIGKPPLEISTWIFSGYAHIALT